LEKNFHDNQLITNFSVGIEEATNKIDTTDEILNPSALKELLHKHGLNMRFEWIVYSKLKTTKFCLIFNYDLKLIKKSKSFCGM
jgi:hypothetical protein